MILLHMNYQYLKNTVGTNSDQRGAEEWMKEGFELKLLWKGEAVCLVTYYAIQTGSSS